MFALPIYDIHRTDVIYRVRTMDIVESKERRCGTLLSATIRNDMTRQSTPHWADSVYGLFKTHHVDIISFVPDAGHKRLIELCQGDAAMRAVTLTTEEEGIALAAGAFLGGRRAALLMQSSGVGNCVNMLSLPRVCGLPLLMLVTMRGEWGEFNPWQVPMGASTQGAFELCGVKVLRASHAQEVKDVLEAAAAQAYNALTPTAVLLSQRLIGAKVFVK